MTMWKLLGAVLIASVTLDAQGTAPRLKKDHLAYLGAIRTPDDNRFGFGGFPFTLDVTRQEFVLGDRYGKVARLKVVDPALPVGVAGHPNPVVLDRTSVPVAPYVDGTFHDLVKGDWTGFHGSENSDRSIGALLVDGDKIAVGGQTYYDASNSQRKAFFIANWPSADTRTPWRQVGSNERLQGLIAGPLAQIPERFRRALKGDVISGQVGLPIITRQSMGPCAISWKLRDLVHGDVPATTMLVCYHGTNVALGGGPWLGPANNLYNSNTEIKGMAFIGDDLVFVGTHGYGEGAYGKGTADKSLHGQIDPGDGGVWVFDPVSSSKGTHSYPYRTQVWSYSVSDLIQVVNGEKQPRDLLPTWFAPDIPYFHHPYYPFPANALPAPKMNGIGYDEAKGLLYVAMYAQDSLGWEPGPLIHVFKVAKASPAPDPSPTAAAVAALKAQIAELQAQISKLSGDVAASSERLTAFMSALKALLSK